MDNVLRGITDDDLKKFIASTEFDEETKQRTILYYVRLAYVYGYNDAISKVNITLPEELFSPNY